MDTTSLETQTPDGLTHYLEIDPNHNVVRWGSHAGSGHTDNCLTINLLIFAQGLSAYDQTALEALFGQQRVTMLQAQVVDFLKKER